MVPKRLNAPVGISYTCLVSASSC